MVEEIKFLNALLSCLSHRKKINFGILAVEQNVYNLHKRELFQMQNINKPEIVPSFNILQSIPLKRSLAFLSSFSGHCCSTVSIFPQVQLKQLLFFLSCPQVARYSFSTFGNPFQRVFCMVLHLTLIALGYKASSF